MLKIIHDRLKKTIVVVQRCHEAPKTAVSDSSGFAFVGILIFIGLATGGMIALNGDLNQRVVELSREKTSTSASVAANSSFNILQGLIRFPSSSPKPGDLPAIYPEPYIVSSPKEPVRLAQFMAANNSSDWRLKQGTFEMQLADDSRIDYDSFNQAFRLGSFASLSDKTTIQLDILETAGTNFLLEKMKVRARFTTHDGQRLVQTAWLKIPKPPRPRCQIKANLSGSVSHKTDRINLSLNIDGMSIQGQLRRNGVILDTENLPSKTRSIKSTNNDILAGNYDLGYGQNTFTGRVLDVEGQNIDCGRIVVVRGNPPPPPSPPKPEPVKKKDPNICQKICPDSSGTPRRNYDWFKGPTARIRKDFIGTGYYPCLLVRAGDGHVDGAIVGFDPNNDCRSVGQIGTRTTGCFSEDTMIRVSKNHYRKINQLVPGMKIWNPINNEYRTIRRIVRGPEVKPMYAIGLGQREVKVTELHPFFTKDGLTTARSLKIGDWILDQDAQYSMITKIEPYTPTTDEQTVYNLELEPASQPYDHAIDADGVVTGDLKLQEQLIFNHLMTELRD